MVFPRRIQQRARLLLRRELPTIVDALGGRAKSGSTDAVKLLFRIANPHDGEVAESATPSTIAMMVKEAFGDATDSDSAELIETFKRINAEAGINWENVPKLIDVRKEAAPNAMARRKSRRVA